MKLKIRRIGNSRGLVLPQQVAETLGDEVEMTVIGNTVVLTAREAASDETRAALAYATVKARRDGLFRRLATQDEER